MATNPPPGDNRRFGAVRERSQFQHPNELWIKRDTKNGRILDIKTDKKPFKGVRREK